MPCDAPNHCCSQTAFRPFPDSALEGSITDRFSEQVTRHAECIALVDGDLRLTYRELDAWANGVAYSLSGGIEPVVVLVAQGATYAAAVLGALKCGRPYVPLEPVDPVARLRTFVESCGATAVLSDSEHAERVAEAIPGLPVVRVDDVAPVEGAPGVLIRASTVAYVFFTSGSTGTPKGVYDTHRNVLHNVMRYTNALEIAPSDGLTLLQGPAFSGCVSSQFGALLNGATSYPFRLRQEGLLRAAAWLDREPITIYHSVPSTFRAIAALEGDFGQVRVVRLEGDRATSADVELWKRRFPEHCLLANGLGTTETGLACQLVVTRAGVVPQGVLPVGYATRDMTVHLVDDAREPVSPGEVGEIAVASNFLALGYWDQPELTAERFAEWGDSRVYFTGDLGRAMEDGCVEYVGRREDDLKVLGQRVEPAEIERELLRSPDVRDVAVTVREGARGDGQVVAYAVPRGSARLDLRSLRVTLAEVLPSAALPTALVELQELPLGPNGKIDRRALPDPDATPVGRSPMSAPEVWLAALWADVLNVEHVSADDDFFALGGDSLAGAQITAQIALETGHSLTLGALVRAPTVRQLAELVSQPETASPSTLTVLRPGDGWPPLLLVHGNTGNTVHYAALVRATGDRRPLWGLEYLEPGADVSVDAVVGAHLVALRRALPEGPYLVAGFCYGGGIALEMAGRLAAEGHEAHLALLGITPLELPSLVSPDAYRRWRHVAGPRPPLLDRVRYHGGVAARAPRRELPRYLALRIRNLARRTIARASHDVSDTSSVARAAQEALASHRPSPFPGRPLVVLHEEDTALYSSDPERDWAALGSEGIELVIAPGSTHSMLESDNASALADVLTTWTADASGESKTR